MNARERVKEKRKLLTQWDIAASKDDKEVQKTGSRFRSRFAIGVPNECDHCA